MKVKSRLNKIIAIALNNYGGRLLVVEIVISDWELELN